MGTQLENNSGTHKSRIVESQTSREDHRERLNARTHAAGAFEELGCTGGSAQVSLQGRAGHGYQQPWEQVEVGRRLLPP